MPTEAPSAIPPTVSSVPNTSEALFNSGLTFTDLRKQKPKFGSVSQSYTYGFSDVQSANITFDGNYPSLSITRTVGNTFIDGSTNRDLIRLVEETYGGEYTYFTEGTEFWRNRNNLVTAIVDFPNNCLSVQCDKISYSTAILSTVYEPSDYTDFVSYGYWATFNITPASLSLDGVEVGGIADGPDFSGDTRYVNDLTGTALYYGDFRGLYISVDESISFLFNGEYSAFTILEVDFDTNMISGCINCDGESGYMENLTTTSLSGVNVNAEIFSTEIGLTLEPINIQSDATFRTGNVSVTGSSVSNTLDGEWSGRLSSDPTHNEVAGVVSASFTETEGDISGIIGGFYAIKDEE